MRFLSVSNELETAANNSDITEATVFIKTMARSHEIICEIIENVNTSYSFQVRNLPILNS